MGKEGEGAKEPDNLLADSQKHMNAASGPTPPLADGILDVCSSPDSSPAPKVSILDSPLHVYRVRRHACRALYVCIYVCVFNVVGTN